MSNDYIKLNVGGEIFETTKTTLKVRTSMLSRLISDNFAEGELSEIFIDRDPRSFIYILNYLRGYDIPIETIPKEIFDMFIQDLNYYCINGFLPKLPTSTVDLPTELTLTGNGRQFNKINKVEIITPPGVFHTSNNSGDDPLHSIFINDIIFNEWYYRVTTELAKSIADDVYQTNCDIVKFSIKKNAMIGLHQQGFVTQFIPFTKTALEKGCNVIAKIILKYIGVFQGKIHVVNVVKEIYMIE